MKKRIKLLAYILASSLILPTTSCGIIQKDNEITTNNDDTDYQKDNTTDVDYTYREELIKQYLNYFKGIKYTYKNEEYYLTDEEIFEIIEIANSITKCTNNKVSYNLDEIIDKIRKNSIEYAETHKDIVCPFVVSKDDEQLVAKKQFEKAIYTVIKEILDNSTNDLQEDLCKFESLKFCYSTIEDEDGSKVTGKYKEELNLIILDYDVIKKITDNYKKYSEENDKDISIDIIYYLELSILHELNHVRQNACDCRVNNGQKNSAIEYEKDKKSTILESSAESDLYTNNYQFINKTESQSYTYSYDEERKNEEMIQLLGLLDHNINDYYNAIFDSDINALLNFVGADSFDKVKQFYRILYAIDAKNNRSSLPWKITDKEELTPNDINIMVGNEYKYELLNLFTIKLINYINEHDDMTIEESLALFNIAQSVCIDRSYYIKYSKDKESSKLAFDADIIKKFNETRKNFYIFLCEYYNINSEDILDISKEVDISVFAAEQYFKNDIIFYNTAGDSKKEFISNLANKFPLLKPILFNGNADHFICDKFYDTCDITLNLGKGGN